MAWNHSLGEKIRHAFALEKSVPDPVEIQFIQKVTQEAKARHLEFPLMMFLEGLLPMSNVAASVLTGLEPAAELFFQKESYQKFIAFLENRGNLERLISSLESEQD